MTDQVRYYNDFGKIHEKNILDCPEPEYWTTDYSEKGRIYQEMKLRIAQQQELIIRYFNKAEPILDIGCGFGRQAVWLARNGFAVTGTDTSAVFISIVQKIFANLGYKGNFICMDLISQQVPGKFKQVLLLDVLEHIDPSRRKKFAMRLNELTQKEAVLIVSLPHTRKRLSSWLNNRIRKNITRHFSWFLKKEEHPYPVPGRNKVLKLLHPVFSLERNIETSKTDYYIFRRN